MMICICVLQDEEALTRPATRVPVDLSLSAYSNARLHHDSRKKQETKAAKTLAAHEEALKAAEKKAAAQLTALRNAGVWRCRLMIRVITWRFVDLTEKCTMHGQAVSVLPAKASHACGK